MDEPIESYTLLRAMLERVVLEWPPDVSPGVRATIEEYLRLTCCDCGRVLDEALRSIKSAQCWFCNEPTRAALRRGMKGLYDDEGDEVPFR